MQRERPITRCEPGCGATVLDVEGPTHAYIGSSPGCWQVYGEVLDLEYADYRQGALHNLMVDAYAVQHPHNADRRNRQSVGVHLISLCALLEHDLSAGKARTLIGDAAFAGRMQGREWPHLVPSSLGAITVTDVRDALGPDERAEWVRRWADSVWAAFSDHHETVRQWLRDAWPGRG
ncbi:DUF5946 family protein [Nocardioides rotundus]|uniref:DUF5946 family protein n=1 Tax=Nocardioides rotundus TaxID=1774216 RepID=UPI001CBB9514|nr:DUF5946 family protein [Nocardioides rotundus]UAL29022.1 DUF5946 family protein [Nocardioides rotundus]